MILSDREIRAALHRGAIRITPDPRQDGEVWASTAFDLRLDGQLALWKQPLTVDPHHPDYDYAQLVAEHSESIVIPDTGYPLEPEQFRLGWTIEKIGLPFRSRIAARVEGRSSLARLGLGVHVTAPTIHAGFGYRESEPDFAGSPIQLEIRNLGPLTILLRKGMRICQLILEEVHGTPDQGYAGQFTVQGPAAP